MKHLFRRIIGDSKRNSNTNSVSITNVRANYIEAVPNGVVQRPIDLGGQ